MLREFSDRTPEPPRPQWQTVLLYGAIGSVTGLLLLNVVQGIATGIWRW